MTKQQLDFIEGEVERWKAYANACPASPWLMVGHPPRFRSHLGLEGAWESNSAVMIAGQIFVPLFVRENAIGQMRAMGV